MAVKRLTVELNKLKENPLENCTIGPVDEDEDMFTWQATIQGPKESPYEGGKFSLSICFPSNCPFKAPEVSFLTKIYHPNVSVEGEICIDLIKNKWSPSVTIAKVFESICSLLYDPELDDPMEPEVAVVFKEDYQQFCDTAREWTTKYAMN
ncbi:uncharacterized protein LOC142346052 [Convolutriloba macropyga]|uniref:uncharacterized protein LOC142346052 n=1 Tax=Convolutriloba macropyga TaxID=536237 RepID=UPI003F5216F1